MISFRGVPLYRVAPPYREFQRVHLLSALAKDEIVPGTILVADVPGSAGHDAVLSTLIPTIRARFCAFPLLLRVASHRVDSNGEAESNNLRLVRRAGELRVRAVFTREEIFPAVVRPILTAPADLPGDVLDWLNVRGHTLSPRTNHLISGIFSHATKWSQVGPLLESTLHISPRSARELCSDRGLPPPSRWLQAARAVRAALRLQADRRTTVYEAALAAGYSDEKTLGRQMNRFFGVQPGQLRDTLGWEWMLDRFLVRHAGHRRQKAADLSVVNR